MATYKSPVRADSDGKQSHTRDFPCPVCGGYSDLPRGRGIRCWGYTLDHVVFCTREEYALGPVLEDAGSSGYKHARFDSCDCGVVHDVRRDTPRPVASPSRDIVPTAPDALPIETRDAIYRAALDTMPPLRPEARDDLRRRGLSDEQIDAHGFRSVPRSGKELRDFNRRMQERFDGELLKRCPGFVDKNRRQTFSPGIPTNSDGYVVPYRDEMGRITGWQVKVLGDGYRSPAGSGSTDCLYNVAGPPSDNLYLTEGCTKGLVAAHLLDVRTFAVPGQRLSDEHIEAIKRLNPARVNVALDQENNKNTDNARARWQGQLHDAGLRVYDAVWEGADVRGPKGLDDLAYEGSRPRIRPVTLPLSERTRRRMPIASGTNGPVEEGGSLYDERKRVEQAVSTFMGDLPGNTGRALLLNAAPGIGKTTAAAEALKRSGVNGRYLVGTTERAAEIAHDHGFAQFQPRNNSTCHPSQLPLVRELEAKGYPVAAVLCGTVTDPRCPFRSTCGYWHQADVPGTRVGTTEQLFTPAFLGGGDILVVDDADLDRALIDRHRITNETLVQAERQLGEKYPDGATVLKVLRHAIVDAGPDSFRGARAWDILAAAARRHGFKIDDLIVRLPKKMKSGMRFSNEGALALADVQAAVPTAVKALLRTLREELPQFTSGEDFNSYLRFAEGGIDLSRVRHHVRAHGSREPLVAQMPMLILDATPVEPLVERLARHHERLPDVRATVPLPRSVHVIQEARAGNGKWALRDERNRRAVLDEVQEYRVHHPVSSPDREAVIASKNMHDDLIAMGFAPKQVMTFGNLRSSNRLNVVERLHIVGRPMPPADEMAYLASVVHHDESPVSDALSLVRRPYGGQPFEIDVLDCVDERAAAFLAAVRDDELVHAIHRARPNLRSVSTSDVLPTSDGDDASVSPELRIIIHSSHPVPGLRVDELCFPNNVRDVNAERSDDAEQRIVNAVQLLKDRGQPLNISRVAREARASRRTVKEHLGKNAHTL